MNPAQIAEEMERTLARLDELVEDTRTAGISLAEAERKFKSTYARARMEARSRVGTSGRPMPEKDADDLATIASEQERFDFTIASQTMTYTREALRAAETRLDVLRSLGASVRGAGG